ncbi:MAG: phosphatase PAP2 family protein, partial [Gemmatimonadales bacterium]
MDLRPVDRLLGAYVVVVTAVILARGGAGAATAWLLTAHVLFGTLLILFARRDSDSGLGGVMHDVYPLLLLSAFYTELGILAEAQGLRATLAHDVTVQGWEATLFGRQISYTWIRSSPSVFWSGLLHLAYLTYYPIILAGPIVFLLGKRREAVRRVVFTLMLGFVLCYLVFLFFPVAGPNYLFSEPTGAARDVWTADVVYAILGAGSAIGTAFPSSHVAATVASVGAG